MSKEMSRPATAGDVHGIVERARGDLEGRIEAVRSELKSDFRRAAVEVAGVKGQLKSLEERLTETNSQNFSKIAKMIEDYAGQVGKLDRRQIITDYRRRDGQAR